MRATTEAAFESLIVDHLMTHGGYVQRPPDAFDPDRALITDDLLAYIRDTQPKTWAKQQRIHGDALDANLLDAFDKATAKRGVLNVLRHGFKFYGARIRAATFQPTHGLNPEVQTLYARNCVAVARQVHFDPKQPAQSLDLVLFVNGIPVATAELKNALTSQDAASAVKQYREDRNPKAPIFRFKRRTLVHFAVGSDAVRMTTRLAGTGTYFLPFDRGSGTAGGNRAVKGKHRTHYLWEQVWARDSLLDIIARFVHLQVDETLGADGQTRRREVMIFPRYHQLDCVRALVKATRDAGAGTNYLVQHSAGSGKSNSIAWLAHRLASLHDADDRKVFHCVVVITDRRVLDQQLQDTIYQFDHKQGVVQKIDKRSVQLADALKAGVPIIISTIHKFGFIADKIDALPDRRYAVIVDEAHSSQSGEMAQGMKSILGGSSIAAKFEAEADDVDTPDQAVLRAALARGRQANLSFFAFTATPKFKTLELFGHRSDDGKPAPFHLYSMRQAIEEGFILDVLRGYTTYSRYFKLVKAIADDPDVDKKKAGRAAARFVSLHPTNIAQKTEVIIEHFRGCVVQRLGGRAKAMVVTASRLHAVRYKRAFDKYLTEKGYTDVGTLVAFSGEVRDPDDPTTEEKPYTEPEMNANRRTGQLLKESELPAAFAGDGYNVLIVANKYQTGFDQPRLVAMYVDKRLSGIQAVQTLSRLNRTAPGKDETMVLDFVNDREEILASFQDYYEGTTVADSVDPQRLYELQGDLDDAQVYIAAEVDHFARIFFKPESRQVASDNARLNAALDPAVDRFAALDDEPAERFRGQLSAFCQLYGFLAQIVPFTDVDLEKRYVFGKMLLKKLPKGEGSEPVDLGDDIALRYYRLQRRDGGDIALSPEGTRALAGPNETGTGTVEEATEKLSTIIQVINDRFATDFDAQDLVDGVVDQMVADEEIQRRVEANTRENFEHVGGPAVDKALIDRHAGHGEFVEQVFADPELHAFLRRQVLDAVFRQLKDAS